MRSGLHLACSWFLGAAGGLAVAVVAFWFWKEWLPESLYLLWPFLALAMVLLVRWAMSRLVPAHCAHCRRLNRRVRLEQSGFVAGQYRCGVCGYSYPWRQVRGTYEHGADWGDDWDGD